MAASTADRVTLPDEQAAPALTQTPARSSAITWVAAGTPVLADENVEDWLVLPSGYAGEDDHFA